MDLHLDKQPAVTYRPAEPLEINLILKNLLTHLWPKDLKTCRLVCRDWHALATKELEKCMARVKLKPGSQGIEDLDEFLSIYKSSTLQPIKFQKLSLSYSSLAAYWNKFHWMAGIISLKLAYVTAQQANGIILPLLHQMKYLKRLSIGICEEPAIRSKHILKSHNFKCPSSQGAYFVLDTFEVTGNAPELLKTESDFLKHCPRLKVFILCLTSSNAPPGQFLKWLEDFRDPAYPRHLQTFSLKFIDCPKLIFDVERSKSISSFISLFPKLQDIQIQLSLSFDKPNVIRVLQDMNNGVVMKNLALAFKG